MKGRPHQRAPFFIPRYPHAVLAQPKAGPEAAGGMAGARSVAADEGAALSPGAEERASLPSRIRTQRLSSRRRLHVFEGEIHLLRHKRDPIRFCKPLDACHGQVALPCPQGPSLRRLTAEVDHIEHASEDEGTRYSCGLFHEGSRCRLFGIERRRHLVPGEGGMAGKVGAKAVAQDLWFVHRTPFCQKHAGCTAQIGRSLQQRLRNETSCR